MFSVIDFLNNCNKLHNCYNYFLDFFKNYIPIIDKITLEVNKEKKNEFYNTIDPYYIDSYFRYLYLHHWYNSISLQQKGNYSFQKLIDKNKIFIDIYFKNFEIFNNYTMNSSNIDVIKLEENGIIDIWTKINQKLLFNNEYFYKKLGNFITSYFYFANCVYNSEYQEKLYKNKLSFFEFFSKRDEIIYSEKNDGITLNIHLEDTVWRDYKILKVKKKKIYQESQGLDDFNNIINYLQEISTLSSDVINKINTLLTFKKGI